MFAVDGAYRSWRHFCRRPSVPDIAQVTDQVIDQVIDQVTDQVTDHPDDTAAECGTTRDTPTTLATM